MQTIARANRVFREKVNGLIVDYVGVFRDLQKALAIYGSGSGGGIGPGESPVADKSELIELLKKAIDETTVFCVEHKIDLTAIQQADKLHRIKLLDDAVDAILVNDESKKRYLLMAGNVVKLYKAILPDPIAQTLYPTCMLFDTIAKKIRSLAPIPDISEVMEDVEYLLDESIKPDGYVIRSPVAQYGTKDHRIDLSKIDFEGLRKKFEKSRKHIETEKLKTAILTRLNKLVKLNRARIDYYEKFQKLIDEYNAGSRNIDDLFDQLVDFAQSLNEEEKRGIKENLSEEELAIFDLLTKPEMSLKKKEEQKVKRVVQDLLETLKREKLVLDWRKRQQTRADVKVSIEKILDELPECFTPEIYRQKCDRIYAHVYDSYFGQGQSIYGSLPPLSRG
jgi:type I restriction enzyme R subunit